MKKTFLFLAALLTATVMTVQAEVLLDDNFDYTAGVKLNNGDYKNMGTDQENWWFYTNKTNNIMVVDTALTCKDYCAKPSGNAIQFKGSTDNDVRAFERFAATPDTSIYYSLLINVKALKNSTAKEYIFSLTDGSTTAAYCYAELRFLNNYTAGTYQLGITKANEVGVRWTPALPLDSTILVVVRYDFIEGEKNDECYMWINPTKLSEGSPTSWCVQDTANPQNPNVKWGANQKVDPSGMKWAYIKPTANTANVMIDEVRIATTWNEIFTGATPKPSIKLNPSSIAENDILQGQSKEYSISVSGKLLTEDVTITHTNNAEVTLSTSSISKEDALSGTSFKVTINAETAEVVLYDTITLVSGTVSKKMPVAWYATPVTTCADVAALKAATSGEADYYVRLSGEAIVTRDTVVSSTRELYIEDATGAAKLTDNYEILAAGSLVGAKIKDLLLVSNALSWGVQPFTVQGKPTVVSTGNEVEPQVVTLAELQENAADYLLELVEIQGVTFTNPGGTFSTSSQSAFSQDTKNANVKVENNSLVGVTVPVKANVIGFSLNTSGSVIVPRGKEDIVEIYTRTVTAGKFGTICLDKKIASMEGVEGMFVPYEVKSDTLYCEEVTAFVAGGAYIFKANAAEVKFTMEGDAVTEPATGNNMLGWLDDTTTVDQAFRTTYSEYYFLATVGEEQQVVKPNDNSQILPNRAMIKLPEAPSAPNRGRLISFGLNGTDAATGLNQLTDSPVNRFTKMMINGQLIIIRDGRMFNAQGQEL